VQGFVPTPPEIVDTMVELLFHGRPPTPDNVVLDPGCGQGVFIEGVLRWCHRRSVPPPHIVGIEMHPGRASAARNNFRDCSSVEIFEADFLADGGEFVADYVVGNPPYVGITHLTEKQRRQYRASFNVASGRFDLYMLFFERALRWLREEGRLVFVTPEKYLYVRSAAPLRRLLASRGVAEMRFLPEDAFPGVTTYPMITTVGAPPGDLTTVRTRDRLVREVALPHDGERWQAIVSGAELDIGSGWPKLASFCDRISCGIATGADRIFVREHASVPASLRPFAYPTIAGRQLDSTFQAGETPSVILCPYDGAGELIREADLGELGSYLRQREVRDKLEGRSCVSRKPWYAFHDSPPMSDILRPKILTKDICERPAFFLDSAGSIIPRHTVYYLVPKDSSLIGPMLAYLQTPFAVEWLSARAQRAANGFLRVQSALLKTLPVRPEVAETWDAALRAPVDDHGQVLLLRSAK